MTSPITRVHYFDGEFLNASDFEAEQQYNIDKLAWLNRSMFTYGIARGLAVASLSGQQLISVSPGMAIDELGRELILTDKATLPHQCRPGSYFLTITYAEEDAEYTVETGVPEYKRTQEIPKLNLTEEWTNPGLHILLAVVTIANNSTIQCIQYNNGISMRRQCGVNTGQIRFPLEGVTQTPAITARQNATTRTVELEISGSPAHFEEPVRILPIV